MGNTVSSNAEVSYVDTVHIIQSDEFGLVQGITTLGDVLYVVKYGSKQIDVYRTLDCKSLNPIPIDLEHPCSLVACSQHNCLYSTEDLFNDISFQRTYYIVKVTLSTHTIDKWIVPGRPMGLSITKTGNLLVSIWDLCSDESDKLLEYSTHGELMRVINLDSGID